MEKIILMLGIIMVLLISGCSTKDNVFIGDNGQEFRSEEEYNWYVNYKRCESSMEEVNHTIFDLFDDYDLTCKKIDFILLSWDSKITREVEDYGFFTNTYKNVDYGVHKSIRLEREVIKYEPSLSNCSTTLRVKTNIYLKEHFINYFMENCLEDD